jgi:hypothetical protein
MLIGLQTIQKSKGVCVPTRSRQAFCFHLAQIISLRDSFGTVLITGVKVKHFRDPT